MRRSLIQRLFYKFDSSILQKVLFIGGRSHFPSVRVRCIEVAQSIGCDYLTDVDSIQDIPMGKEIFICVKPLFDKNVLEDLQKQGVVIWDIHDNYSPRNYIDYYLVSSQGAYQKFKSYGSIYIIPHHHCNFSGIPNPIKPRIKPTWIGSQEWLPEDLQVDVEFYNSKQMDSEAVIDAYRNSTILLNVRASRSITSESTSEHIKINPGVKLINSIGFGVPSLSNDEPAYREIGSDCTVFVKNEECKEWVLRLQQDDALYTRLRNNCILKAPDFSLPNIAKKYMEFLTRKI
jgi:hypothetical protein